MNLALKYIKRYSKGYLIGFILLVAINSIAAYIPQLIKGAINKLEKLSGASAELSSSISYTVLIIIGLALLMALFRVSSRRVIFGIGRNIECDLKKDIFDHLITLSPSFFTERKTGDLISIITNDVQSIRALTGFAILNILNTLIAFSIIVPLMLELNSKLTITFLAVIPVALLLVTLISRNLKTYQEFVQEKLGQISHFVEQNLSGIHIIKAYAQEASELLRFKAHNDELLAHYIKLIKARSVVGPAMRLIANIGLILLLYIGGKAVIDDHFSLGDFTAFAFYIERLIWPVATLGWLITVYYRAKVSSARIEHILNAEATIKDSESSVEKNDFQREIHLKSLNVSIPKGSRSAIVGTIASGKSTLANKLMHLTELNADEIFIDDVDLSKIKLNSLRALINMVPQNSFLFSTSIKENIAYAVDISDSKLIELAKLVGLHDEIMKFPDTYESIVGERGVTLSGGQRQRVAIARALAINPEILILDDALSSIDDKTAALILENISKLRSGKTTIFITHKISILEDFDQIYVMDKFKIVEHGVHNDLISEDGVYKTLWEIRQNAI